MSEGEGEGVMLSEIISYLHTDIAPINLMLLNTAIFHSSEPLHLLKLNGHVCAIPT